MLHLSIESQQSDEGPAPYAEAVARLASIRHALRLVDPFGGGPASDPDEDLELGVAWAKARPARRRCFDTRSSRVIASTAEGLEALLASRSAGAEPNPAASRRLAEEIRLGLKDISELMLRA